MTDYTTKRIVRHITEQLQHAMVGDWASLSSAAVAVSLLAHNLQLGVMADAGAFDTNAPLGFDTVIGYAMRVAPILVQYVPNIREFITEQEAVLIAACLSQQGVITSVTAPEHLKSLGVETCHAFPLTMLRAHFEV